MTIAIVVVVIVTGPSVAILWCCHIVFFFHLLGKIKYQTRKRTNIRTYQGLHKKARTYTKVHNSQSATMGHTNSKDRIHSVNADEAPTWLLHHALESEEHESSHRRATHQTTNYLQVREEETMLHHGGLGAPHLNKLLSAR